MPCSGNSNRVTIPNQPIKGTRPVWDNLFDRVVVRSLHRVVKGGQNVLSGEKNSLKQEVGEWLGRSVARSIAW